MARKIVELRLKGIVAFVAHSSFLLTAKSLTGWSSRLNPPCWQATLSAFSLT